MTYKLTTYHHNYIVFVCHLIAMKLWRSYWKAKDKYDPHYKSLTVAQRATHSIFVALNITMDNYNDSSLRSKANDVNFVIDKLKSSYVELQKKFGKKKVVRIMDADEIDLVYEIVQQVFEYIDDQKKKEAKHLVQCKLCAGHRFKWQEQMCQLTHRGNPYATVGECTPSDLWRNK